MAKAPAASAPVSFAAPALDVDVGIVDDPEDADAPLDGPVTEMLARFCVEPVPLPDMLPLSIVMPDMEPVMVLMTEAMLALAIALSALVTTLMSVARAPATPA